jgi:hypothetical protein
MVLLRCLRPDKLIFAVRNFVAQNLGADYVKVGVRVARFFVVQQTKKRENIPNDPKIYRMTHVYQMILKYTK